MRRPFSSTRHRATSSSPPCGGSGPIPRPATPTRRRRSGKITQDMFTPRTLRPANAAKRYARRAAAVENPFPMDKHQFNMAVIRRFAILHENEFFETYERLLLTPEVAKDVTIFVSLFSLVS